MSNEKLNCQKSSLIDVSLKTFGLVLFSHHNPVVFVILGKTVPEWNNSSIVIEQRDHVRELEFSKTWNSAGFCTKLQSERWHVLLKE